MNNIISKTIFLWITISVSFFAASSALANEYLAENKEVVFSPELVQLAENLNHDPIKIYNWVYENIEFENYDYARKNALNVYWTKRGNEWDQTTLLITLMRLSNIEARYLQLEYDDQNTQNKYKNSVIAEVLLPVQNYRGYSNNGVKEWIPLAPWKKEYKTTAGLDLFPNNEIPPELNFDFDDYVKSIKQKTSVELYEEQLQSYLDINYPNKTLKDIGYSQTIIKKNTSILPLSLPRGVGSATYQSTSQTFSEIPNEQKYKVTYYLKSYQSSDRVLEYDLYLPEISTSRIVLDFIPFDETNASKIAPYQLITKTPAGEALVKAVLKIDGNVVATSSAFTTGDDFFDGQDVYAKTRDRLRKKVGTTLALGVDPLISSEKMIEKLKDELSELSLSLLDDDYTKEEYLGRYLTILMQTYDYRNHTSQRKIDHYFSMSRDYLDSIWVGRAYTFANDINVDNDEKFAISDSMIFDYMGVNAGAVYDFSTGQYVDYFSEIRELMDDIHIYDGSYNEGRIFEDWQSTPGGSTIKALMVAHEQGIPVVTLTKDDIDNGHLYILENQTNNRYSDSEIQSIIADLNKDWEGYRQQAEVTLPVQELHYEGATLIGRISGPAYLFSINHGSLNNGGGSVSIPALTITTKFSSRDEFSTDPLDEHYDFSFLDTNSSWGTGSGSYDTGISYSYDNSWVGRQRSFDGDPVDMLTGEFYQEEIPDISLKSTVNNKLEIKRTYKSQLDYNGVFGYGWAWNHMDRIILSDGNTLLYVDDKGVFSSITQHSNTSYTYPNGADYTLNFADSVYTLTKKDGSIILFDSNGLLREKSDPNGNTLYFEYNDQHNINLVRDGHGKSLSLSYNANHKVTSVTDGQGLTTHYSYDDDDLIAYSDAVGNTTSYEYLKNQENPANNHNMSKYTLPNGDYLELVYYKNDQVSHHTNKKGDTFNFQYSRYNQYAETWNEAGYYRKVFFNDNGDVIRTDTRDGTLELKEYDANHNVIAYTDANGHRSTYTYDDKRNLLSKTNALNETYTYEYETTFNKLTKQTDPKGNITTYSYDNKGKLTRMVDALLHDTRYEYDNFGNQIKIIDALGNEVINSYDTTGSYLVSQTDKSGNTTSYTYDNVGNVLSSTNAIGDAQQTQYNQNNQMVEHSDQNGAITLYEYDENKNLVKKTLANGAVYEYSYYTAKDIVIGNLLKQEIDPLGHSVNYAYDKLGNRTEVTDKNGHTTYYTYNQLKKISSKKQPNGHITSYHYDGLGNLVRASTTKRNGYDTLDIVTSYTYDPASRLTSKTLPNGQSFYYEYDKNGNTTIEKHTINNQEVITSYSYNALNKPTQIVQGVGSDTPRTTTIEYGALQRKVKETNAIGVSTRYVYDNNSNLLETRVEEAQGPNTDALVLVNNEYNTLNQLAKQTDANGNSTTYVYDAKGQLVNKTDALNNTYVYHYDNVGNQTQQTLPTGSSIKYHYDAANHLIQQTNSLGHSEYLSYDPNGNLTKRIDAKGNITLFAYNSLNQQVSQTDSYGNISTLAYDELGNRIVEVNEAGEMTEYDYDINNNLIQQRQLLSYSEIYQTDFVYDSLNRLTSITDAKGNSTSYTYNIFNEKTITTDALAQTITQQYDALGRVIKVTDKAGIISETHYDNLGRVTSTQQASGSSDETITHFIYDNMGNRLSMSEGISPNIITTHASYDALNRMLSTSVNNQLITSQSYDALGNVLSKTDANGNTTLFTYNANNQLTQQTDAKGNISHFSYDENGNPLSQTSPEGVTVINEYDALNRLVTRHIGNAQQSFSYDKASRITLEIDFNGNSATTAYDALGRVLQETTAKDSTEEATTHYTYDENSNLTGIQNANGEWISYNYDALNRKIKQTYASGAYETFSYDQNDNLVTTTQKNNTIINNTYDDLNRLASVAVGNVIQQEFSYDALSRLISSKDHNQGTKTNTVNYVYDDLNNIIQATQNGHVVNHSYDLNSNVTAITANGIQVNNTYDSLNSLSRISTDSSNLANLVYDNDNRRAEINTSNGMSLTIDYDQRSRETERSYTTNSHTLFQQASNYDLNSNVITETITQNNRTLIKNYQYDAQDRLTDDQQNDHYFIYDLNNNITGTNQNGFVETREVDSDDQYSAIFGDQANTIEHDTNGNISQYNNRSYRYDYHNRLVEVLQNSTVLASYTYDAENRRVSKTVNGITTHYLYDNNQVIQEIVDTETTPSIHYIYSDQLDDPIAFIKDDLRYFYLKDRLGSVRAITDNQGNIVESYDYSAFGVITIKDANGVDINQSALGNSYTYAGRRFDAETGLYYYRNRMYSAELGRFISEDPVGYQDGYNLYQYAHNNPLKYVDPLGTTAVRVNSGVTTTPNNTYTHTRNSSIVSRPAGYQPRSTTNYTTFSGSDTGGYHTSYIGGSGDSGTSPVTAPTPTVVDPVPTSAPESPVDVSPGASEPVQGFGGGSGVVDWDWSQLELSATDYFRTTNAYNPGGSRVAGNCPNCHTGSFVAPSVITPELQAHTRQFFLNNVIEDLIVAPISSPYHLVTGEYFVTGDDASRVQGAIGSLPLVGYLGRTGVNLYRATRGVPRGGENVAQFEKLRSSLAAKEIINADRVGSALAKSDKNHLSASFVSELQLAAGKIFPLRGNDGIQRTLLQTKGQLDGQSGVFEFILEQNGTVSHQLFQKGRINGVPIKITK